jgi:hypothetical protein
MRALFFVTLLLFLEIRVRRLHYVPFKFPSTPWHLRGSELRSRILLQLTTFPIRCECCPATSNRDRVQLPNQVCCSGTHPSNLSSKRSKNILASPRQETGQISHKLILLHFNFTKLKFTACHDHKTTLLL